MRIELKVEARADLADAAAFYDRQRDGLGEYFVDCLFTDLIALESQAGIHEVVHGLHRKLSRKFPFAIYYRVSDSVAYVVAILDCRRDPKMIAKRLSGNT